MRTSESLLWRLLDWFSGATGGERTGPGPAGAAPLATDPHSAQRKIGDEEGRDLDREDRERELELRILMCNWM